MTPSIVTIALLAIIAYAYVGYPLYLALLLTLRKRRDIAKAPSAYSVSIILAANNEAAHLPRRLNELCAMLEQSGHSGEIIVVSDGSTDATVAVAESFAARSVKTIELEQNVGKSAAISRGAAHATGTILVFADARQHWKPDALIQLLNNFSDPAVGAVSGELLLESSPGIMAGVGLYWRYEKWIRHAESRTGSVVGVSGSIAATRRQLFCQIPQGALLDDVYWPMRVAMRGYRVIYDRQALAMDRLPPRAAGEFRRKVRTLAGNFQLLVMLPQLLLPWRNPLWFRFLSHKLVRLAVPWAMLGLLIIPFIADGPLYRALGYAQLVFYALALLGLLTGGGGRILGALSSLLVLNAAAFVAFWMWISGRAAKSWSATVYHPPAGAAPAVATIDDKNKL